MAPSFLQSLQPSVSPDSQPVADPGLLPPSTSGHAAPSIPSSTLDPSPSPSTTTSRTSSMQPSTRSKPGAAKRKKKQWSTKSSVDGLLFYSLALTVAAGVGLYKVWKWWQKKQSSKAASRKASQPTQMSHGAQASKSSGGRSAFNFDKPGKGKKGSAAGGGASVAPPAAKIPPIPVTQMSQPPLRKGNPKKDKALRQERKAAKEARKQAAREAAEQLSVASQRAAEAAGKDEPRVVTYIDYDKTSEAYQRVAEWQETGKKRYD